ncbi:hypothetical protein MUK42_02201 [Musa troglodytarum]|uniref:Uncharacterized protein n=1 Tax=Musa troglodytarum TaxID=320322 RepID=A0A9E7L839_9LILI|nr:hypothetical protein MUK42_02201 [Musa troglodytarum]
MVEAANDWLSERMAVVVAVGFYSPPHALWRTESLLSLPLPFPFPFPFSRLLPFSASSEIAAAMGVPSPTLPIRR